MTVLNTCYPACLKPFIDERLAVSLGQLSALLKDWERWPAGKAADPQRRYSPNEDAFRRIIGHKLLEQLQAAAEAASACTGKATATEAAT